MSEANTRDNSLTLNFPIICDNANDIRDIATIKSFFFGAADEWTRKWRNKNTIRCHCARWFMMHTMHRTPATRERDYINKYEHIGLREGMHNAWKSYIQHWIKKKVNVLPLMLLFLLYVKSFRTNFNHILYNGIQFENV